MVCLTVATWQRGTRTKPGVISVAVVTGATIDAVLPSGALLANLRGIQVRPRVET
jgi:hypothetical protein